MFSINSQNQILYQLGLFSPKRNNFTLKKSKNNENNQQQHQNNAIKKIFSNNLLNLDILSDKSLNQILSFNALELHFFETKKLNILNDKKNIKLSNNEKLNKILNNPINLLSNNTFNENKLELHQNNLLLQNSNSERLTINGKILNGILFGDFNKNFLQNFCVATSLGGRYEVRHFKTSRTKIADRLRNPSILTRIKNTLTGGGGGGKPNPSTIGIQNDALTKLLNEMKDSPDKDVKKTLKVAFAEGYMAANQGEQGGKNSGKAMKYLKVFQQLLIIVVFLGIFISLFSSSNGSVFRIQLGNQVEVDPEEINISFDDVKGCDEAKQELKEVVEFLKNPDKFSNLGGKLPKGVLLVGPPGTGKTLLARAVAGEAGVPFFHAAGPEFDEVLVGQGARRVRDLFKAAKERAPCVIFIDEIDSVGAKRTNSVLHPYANQTINQLLSEMDGFHQNEGVIVLGATNRRDDLDQALLRPGRFDVEVVVPTPDFSGRKEIIVLYLSKILHDRIDIDLLARGTSGFTGADIENMINQAALRAAIDGADNVTMRHLESARDKVLMGPERKARLPDEEANRITAYHEGGHAIVAYFTKESHPLHKVTIMPRGPSLGHTAYIPEKERYHVTKAQLLAMMDTMMGGRAAEEIIFGADKITSGASSDLKQATSIASHMVKDWGMSEKVGLRTIVGPQGLSSGDALGPNTVEAVDVEIRKILNDSYERAKAILKTHSKEHKALAEALLKYETLDAEDIKAIVKGGEKKPAEVTGA